MQIDSRCMKVGNSLTITIPVAICSNYKLKKGDDVKIITTDKGIFIPLTPIKHETLQGILKGLK